MRILITDVTGLVGRAVARQLVAAGQTVSGIAKRPHRCLDPGVDFVCAPLDDPVLQELADDADVVLHLAPVDTGAPGAAGINGVAHVSDAAARAGDRLLFVSQAAGHPSIYRQAERLVSTGWAPSLIIRAAPPVGRQLDWTVCRTVTTLLHTKISSQPVRLLHLDDLVRFLVLAVASNRTGVVDLATPDATNVITARRLLEAATRTRHHRLPNWFELTPELNVAVLQEDWTFEFGWQATDAVADTARGLAGRRLDVAGAIGLPGHLPLPAEPAPRRGAVDSARLRCAAPEGLEGEFDDRIDPRFPVFSATGLTEALPGPLTPMTLDVQLAGMRSAGRVMTQVMTPGIAVAAEWGSRSIAVFGHRPYAAVSAGVLAAGQLPGWDPRSLAERALGDKSLLEKVFPAGRLPPAGGMRGSAAKVVATGRALALLRHLKSDTEAYGAAAVLEHVDAAKLTSLTDGQLEARVHLLRSRVHQGWGLTALWVIDSGITAATLARSEADSAVPGIDALIENERVVDKVSALAAPLRRDPRLGALAARGDLDGIRASSRTVAAAFVAAVTRMAHRGPGEAELGNPTFGDEPALLLMAAADAAKREPAKTASSSATLAQRMAANAHASRELAYDTTLRFTHELRMTLRELGARRVSAESIDTVRDVFYLTCDELLTVPPDARLRIKRRRAERERLQTLRLPHVIDHGWTPLDSTGQ